MTSTITRIEHYSHAFVRWTATSQAFIMAACLIALWMLGGAYSGYSTIWQNAFCVFTSIATFLLLFLMQRWQSKEFQAIQVKLNEIIAVDQNASNELINIETQGEAHLETVHREHDKRKTGEL
jgi:low affinity Fe/Cu permease